MFKSTFLSFIALVVCGSLSAQITVPPGGGNQKSVVTQYIGAIAHVTITYNSPDVTAPDGTDRNGQIWGQLVPYGKAPNNFGTAAEIPWRAGANENTVFEFSHDMEIEGQPIPAGRYGFHVIPRENGPWTLIFSQNSDSWGSYFYDEAEDALRVTVTPNENTYREWLTYEFIDRQPDQTTVALMWENLSLPFTISVPNNSDLYLSQIRNELRNSPGFNWQSWSNAANYALNNNGDLEEALAWAEAAVGTPFIGQANFTTLSTQAQVLMALERTEEALGVMDQAIKHPTATPFQVHAYGRQLIAQGQAAKALEIFEYNYQQNDGAWPTHVGMARGLSATGQYRKAIEHAEKALAQAPDDLNRNNLEQSIERLKQGEDIN